MPETVRQAVERIERQVAEEWKKQDIICPKCQYVFDQDYKQDYVTYWGDGDPVETECPNCEASLLVVEQVTRTFEVTSRERVLRG